jgi:potassium-transporting ATPase potassium-binding subunit
MLIRRCLTLLPMLAVAESLAAKATVLRSLGKLSTETSLFTDLPVFVAIAIDGLTFLPSLALGPVAEQLTQVNPPTLLLGR